MTLIWKRRRYREGKIGIRTCVGGGKNNGE